MFRSAHQRELDALVEDYEQRVGSYRRELADLQQRYERTLADLNYAREVTDGLDVQALKDLDFWRHEAGRASAAEKAALEWSELRLKTVEARERDINVELAKSRDIAFRSGWAAALYELEGEIGKGVALIRYEDDYSPYFKLYNETMEDLLNRIRERGENWDGDEAGFTPVQDFDDDQYTGDY